MTIPEGHTPGDVFKVDIDGQSFTLKVPPGMRAGQQLKFATKQKAMRAGQQQHKFATKQKAPALPPGLKPGRVAPTSAFSEEEHAGSVMDGLIGAAEDAMVGDDDAPAVREAGCAALVDTTDPAAGSNT